ncbi:MAG: hypothetical protein IPL45_07660 [Actinomycetales bacterium]|nr:hypothetical protein [Actinomycetales bacterium]
MTPLSALPAGKANLTGRVAPSAVHSGLERDDAAYRICPWWVPIDADRGVKGAERRCRA